MLEIKNYFCMGSLTESQSKKCYKKINQSTNSIYVWFYRVFFSKK